MDSRLLTDDELQAIPAPTSEEVVAFINEYFDGERSLTNRVAAMTVLWQRRTAVAQRDLTASAVRKEEREWFKELLKEYDNFSQYYGGDRSHPVRRLDIPNDVMDAVYRGERPDKDGG